ncbi:MAG TPA: cyclopropane-fatty-acyl-phospholipid synthase family protein [Methylibium sp.]|uniref:SAM-dependent methyltransferase n=1 Tax=Methylibium sp. TaxID=2067992 RepID=UPI002DBA7867|nr:cyclopropane-fatty-acyl-phospholipid synthase family protein [Methylibium sp.]HEU4459403.1 cyclopropane-fatty-acyl-phospholipid synthase family protein [Methylibium sp.]
MTSSSTATALGWVEQGLVPDRVVRLGIRRLLKQRLAEIGDGDAEAAARRTADFVASMSAAPLALVPEKANEQHYEVPAAFFAEVLGRHRKYSSCWWPESGSGPDGTAGVSTLDEAEAAALGETCARAGLRDGQQVLELGCGWGSLSLWMAERFPSSRITAVSNSNSQRENIEAEARRRGLANLRVVTCDFNTFETTDRFDRIVSVEMFEHLRNWPAAFAKVASWLAPEGRFFMHVFAHRSTPYAFVERDATDWMSRHFFSGGMMPSDDLALHCQRDLSLVDRWRWDGRHYQKTSEAWLANMDAKRDAVWPVLEATYGADQAALWWTRWRLFFMSVAELFGHGEGQQWWVSHYLFERNGIPRA